jgi:hypothetical protein
VIRMRTSLVAWSFLFSVALFCVFYVTLPYDRFLDLALATAYGVSLAGIVRYGREAFRAVRAGQTGAQFLLVAVFAIFVTNHSQRVWAMVLRIMDRPDWLVNSYFAIGIPWMMAWAMSLAVVAPDIQLETSDEKSSLWKSVAFFVGGALAGFLVAVSFGVKSGPQLVQMVEWPQLLNRARCPADKPVWVSSKGVYHVSSEYKGMMSPRWCFATVKEAEEKGFRPPRGSKPSG